MSVVLSAPPMPPLDQTTLTPSPSPLSPSTSPSTSDPYILDRSIINNSFSASQPLPSPPPIPDSPPILAPKPRNSLIFINNPLHSSSVTAASASPSSPTPASPLPPASPIPIDPVEKNAHRANKRSRIISEIHSTEQYYVTSLTKLVAHYLTPLKTHCNDYNLNPKQVSTIFSNIEPISGFHSILLSELEKVKERINETDNVKPVCQVFLKFADFLRMYIPYVNNYSEAIKTLTLLTENKKFTKLLNENKNNMGMDLMSYLIMPVQRIPRYELLLKELKRNLDRPNENVDTEESLLLDEALSKIVAVATKVNEMKRQAERISTLLTIQSRLTGMDTAFTPPTTLYAEHRRLVKEGDLYKKTTFTRKSRRAYLFNDLFLWCSGNKYKGHINLLSITINAIGEETATSSNNTSNENEYGIEIIHPHSKAMILYTESLQERSSWLSAFQEAMAEAKTLDEKIIQTIPIPTQQQVEHSRKVSFSSFNRQLNVPVEVSTSSTNSPHIPLSPRETETVEEGEEDGGADEEEKETDHSNLTIEGVEKEEKADEKKDESNNNCSNNSTVTQRINSEVIPILTSINRSSQSSPAEEKQAEPLPIILNKPPPDRSGSNSRTHSRKNSKVINAAPVAPPKPTSKIKPSAIPRSSITEKDATNIQTLDNTTAHRAGPIVAPTSELVATASSLLPPPVPPTSSPSSSPSLLSSLTRNHLTSLKSMKNAALPVKLAVESLAILLDLPVQNPEGQCKTTDYWLAVQPLLVKPTLLKILLEFEQSSKMTTSDNITVLKGYIHDPRLTVENVNTGSAVVATLWRWVRAQYVRQTGEILPIEAIKSNTAAKVVASKTDSGKGNNSRPSTPFNNNLQNGSRPSTAKKSSFSKPTSPRSGTSTGATSGSSTPLPINATGANHNRALSAAIGKRDLTRAVGIQISTGRINLSNKKILPTSTSINTATSSTINSKSSSPRNSNSRPSSAINKKGSKANTRPTSAAPLPPSKPAVTGVKKIITSKIDTGRVKKESAAVSPAPASAAPSTGTADRKTAGSEIKSPPLEAKKPAPPSTDTAIISAV